MPSTTRPTSPGASTQSHVPKRHSDLVSEVQTKKPRVDPSQARTRRYSNRDTNKRRKKKKKAPIVGVGSTLKNESAADGARQTVCPPAAASSSSARPQIMRFPSEALETKPLTSKHTSNSPMPRQRSSVAAPVHSADTGTTSSSPKGKSAAFPCPNPVSEPDTASLEDRVERLSQELAAKNKLLASHQALLLQMQQSVTCQICLDLMHKPFALSPCGHLACYDCLIQWFRAPPQDNRPAPPAISRKKTCPHCRAVIHERPIEVWGVKNIVQSIAKSSLVPNLSSPPPNPPENQNTNADPWAGIFSKARQGRPHPFPWFGGGEPDHAPRHEDIGMLDMEDGGIYRCLDCMHEIWHGVCTNCDRRYPGHVYDPEDDGLDLGAEEVEDDDPGWMGLVGGMGDDIGDEDEDLYRQFPLWPIARGFIGAMDFYEVDDEDDEEEYEDSFIDDGSPRIHEIHSDDDYASAYSHSQVEDNDVSLGPSHVRPVFFSDDNHGSESDAEDNDVSLRPSHVRPVFFSDGNNGSESDAPRGSPHRTSGVVLSSESEAELTNDNDWSW